MANNDSNLVFGVNPVLEILKAGAEDVLEILLSETSDRSALRFVRQEAQRLGVRLISVSPKALDQLVAGYRHQGIVARVKVYRYVSFTDMIEKTAASLSERILVLDGVTDPRNFGAILRTADAAGVRYVVIPKDRSADVTPIAVKASAGATYHINIVKVTNLRRAIMELKEHGYWVAGLDSAGKETIFGRAFPARLAVLIGSEGSGVRPINLRECDLTVSIPMLGKVSSLNVSVAVAVFLYELVRQAHENNVP